MSISDEHAARLTAKAAALEAQASEITRDRMLHYGYTPEQIAVAERTTHPAAGCHYEHPYGWVCTDEDDRPRHPIRDELDRTAEFVVWVLEHPSTYHADVTEWRELTPPASNDDQEATR